MAKGSPKNKVRTRSRKPPPPADRRRGKGITLSFRQVECRCKAVRVVGVKCPYCGELPAPHEVDPQRQRRQAAARRARVALAESWIDDLPPRTVAELALDLDGLLAPWMKGSIPVLDNAAADPDALVEHARQVVKMEALLRNTPRFRPSIALYDLLRDLVAEAKNMFKHYLDAIGADDLGAAQRLAIQGQEAIDRGVVLINKLTGVYEEANDTAAGSTPEDALRALAAKASVTSGGANILTAANQGEPIFKEITGRADGCEPVLGLWLLMNSTNMASVGDHGRFIKVAQEAYAMLLDDPRGLTLVQSPQWREDMRHAAVRTFDSGAAAMAMLSQATSDRMRVDALMNVGHDLVEALSRPHVATIRHLHHKGTYQQVKSKCAHEVLGAIENKFGHLTVGLDSDLRHAKAHSDYRPASDGVDLFNRDGSLKRHLAGEELINAVLAGHESIVGLTAGFLCAVAVMGEPVEAVLPSADALPWRTSIIGVLELNGWRGISIAESDPSEVVITGTPTLTPRASQTAFMIAGYLPPSVETIRAVSSDCTSELVAPLGPIRVQAEETDEYINNIRFVEALRAARVNGQPCIDDALFRRWAATKTAATLKDEFPTCMRHIRMLVQAAKADGDDELARGLRASLTVKRITTIGIGSLGDQEKHHFDQLVGYLGADVDREWLDKPL